MASMRLITTTLLLLSVLGTSKAQLSNISDMDIALAEMKAGSYYGFVMLLQMLVESGSPILTRDVTFLMPNDSLLADHTSLPLNTLPDFLLRHTIHPQQRFNNLLHLPNGTSLPSSLPNYNLIVSNYGSRNFSLNNAQIVFPNVCRASRFISCHGISDVLITTITPPPPSTPPSPPPHPSPSPSPHPSSPSPVPQAPHITPPPPSTPQPAPVPVPAPAPAPALEPAPAPPSNEAMPRAYISVLVLFISTIVAVGLVANP